MTEYLDASGNPYLFIRSYYGASIMTFTGDRINRRRAARTNRHHARRLLVERLEQRQCLTANLSTLVDFSQLEIDPTDYDGSSLIVRYRDEASQPSGPVYGPVRTASIEPIGFDMQKVELKAGVDWQAMIESYQQDPDVLYAEPDYQLRIAAIPDDPRFAEQWDLNNVGQDGGTIDADIDAPEAWDLTTGTRSTIVAVIDTGVDYLHPDLAPNMWTNDLEIEGDGIDNDGNGFIDDIHGYDFFNNDGDPMDDNNHGTHVAGTIGAVGNDGIGIAGINWNVEIMALKFLSAGGSGSTSDAVAAVQYAIDNGAHISNNSWGGGPSSQAMYDVIEAAGQQGHIFVAASGNGDQFGIGINNDLTPFYPASYELDNVVAVAATDRNDQVALFSNYGQTSVDIGAPGVSILSTLTGGGYDSFNGTSMATPHVTGAISLVRDYDPTLTPQQLIDRVMLSADPIDALDGITVTGGRLNLAAAMIPDTTGPRIADVQPSDLTLDPFSSLTVSFNEAIEATTFTLDDIVRLTGPEGDIDVTSVDVAVGSNSRKFELTFATQSVAGEYELVISPDITDRFDNLMDQNENGIGGETTADQFTHTFSKLDAVARFDFGTPTSPVAPGYTGVIGGDTYNSTTGYGWQSGLVSSLSRDFADPLTRDANYTSDATFALDVPNGEYDVIITMGQTLNSHDEMGVYLEGFQVDQVSTAAGEFVVNTYRTGVSDGQLTLRLHDLGGSDPWVMINAMDVVFAGPDSTGPRVVASDATGTLTGPIDRLTVSFNEPIDSSSFTLADVAELSGPLGPITPTAVNPLPAGEFEITFDAQNDAGAYRLVIGPDILDVGGNMMDQDLDGVSGETVDDQFVAEFTLEPGLPVVARFDFGSATSPVADGYTQVTGSTSYDAATGYGWQSGNVYAISWGGEPLTRDLNYTVDGTFAVDLPNGEYDFVITMGEEIVPHDQMGVFLEGVQVDSIDTAGSQFVTNTYRTSIGDGQLTLRLQDLGGSNNNAAINGLEILYVGPDTTGPNVISTDATGTITGPIDVVGVTFNEPIDGSSFTLADIAVLEGPLGPITPTAIHQVATGDFEIEFDPQNDPGIYRLVIGPDINDVGGNVMDQDGDGVGGEASEDQFETTFTLEAGLPTVARFDFGTASSPVETDYTQVTAITTYNATSGFGWQSGSVFATSWGGEPLTRDLNYTRDATFAADLPNGEYDFVITMGQAIIAHDQMGVYLEGVQVDSVDTAGYQFETRTYRTSISDGQLTLRLHDLGGSNLYAAINSLEILYVGPDTSGPLVISTDAVGTITGPLDQIQLSFNEPIDPSSLSLADIAVLEGPSGSIVETGLTALSDSDYAISFAPQNDPGLYRLVLGPDVVDISGNLMDQDQDGVGGESVDDQFETTFTLEAGLASVARFDFGNASSQLESDYTRVTAATGYSAANGFGWQSGSIYAMSWGGEALTRDLNYTRDGTFAVDLANGEYDLVITMGQTIIAHDQMGVFVEGTQVDTVSTAGSQFVTNTYRVTINDGQLTLRLQDLGGSNVYAVINALEILAAE